MTPIKGESAEDSTGEDSPESNVGGFLREVNYRFTLSEVYEGDVAKAALEFETDTGLYTISISIPSSGALGIDFETQEEADDFHDRLSWLPSWAMEPTLPMKAEFGIGQPNYVYSMDSGILELGAQTENIKEYFVHGNTLKGILRLKQQDEYSLAKNEFSHGWKARFFPATDVPRPFVLSEEAISHGWIPEEGYRALPKHMGKHVPLRLRYWKENDQERRLAIRNHLVRQIQEGRIFIPYSKTYNARFTLFQRQEDKEDTYHILIHSNKPYQYSTHQSPIGVEELTLREAAGLGIDDGKEELAQVEGHTYKAVDWGKSTIYEDYADHKVIEFFGAKHSGLWKLARQSENLWDFTLEQPARNRTHSLPPEKVDTIIEMSRQKKDRPEIADAIGYSNQTVWVYQKQLGLI